MFSFTSEILSDFLLTRGFEDVRTDGRFLNATASFNGNKYAFIVVCSPQKVYKRKWRKYHIYRRFIEYKFRFAKEIGYDIICAIMIHSNDTITISELSEESFIQNQTYALLNPVSYWRPVISADRTFFYKIRDKEFKMSNYALAHKNARKRRKAQKSAEKYFVICDGVRVIHHTNAPDETIECLLRDSCHKYTEYTKYEKAKEEGKIAQVFGILKAKRLKNVVSKFNDLNCINFKQNIPL